MSKASLQAALDSLGRDDFYKVFPDDERAEKFIMAMYASCFAMRSKTKEVSVKTVKENILHIYNDVTFNNKIAVHTM